MVRFRTLGCYPLTGAVESHAATLPEIIQEMLLTTTSERQGRVIDHDSSGSMEKKNRKATSKPCALNVCFCPYTVVDLELTCLTNLI